MAKHIKTEDRAVVLVLLDQGRTNREIARIAGLTYNQVRRIAITRDTYVRDPRGRKSKPAA